VQKSWSTPKLWPKNKIPQPPPSWIDRQWLFWAYSRLSAAYLQRTKFHATSSIRGWLTFRNSIWQPSAILELLVHHIGPPTTRYNNIVKFYVNLLQLLFLNIWGFDLFEDLAWNAYSCPPKFQFWGIWTTKRHWSSSRPQKARQSWNHAFSALSISIRGP